MTKNAIVTGGKSGLGKLIADGLVDAGFGVWTFDKTEDGCDVRVPHGTPYSSGIIKAANETGLDVLVNCAGINRIGWLDSFDGSEWDEVMDTNAKGIFQMTKALLPGLSMRRGTVLNIVSNAAHVPMTCSAAYNASKGAALILTKQLARELTKKDGITVFSVSPNKLAGTGMSKDIEEQVVATRGWTAEEARRYQLAAMPTGKETPPELVAEFCCWLLETKKRHEYLTGCDIPYGA